MTNIIRRNEPGGMRNAHLKELQTSVLDEGPAGLHVVRQQLGELS